MKYKPKQKVMFKKYESQIAFCYENYRYGKNAYTIKFKRGSTELHRLRYEDELGQCSITSSQYLIFVSALFTKPISLMLFYFCRIIFNKTLI